MLLPRDMAQAQVPPGTGFAWEESQRKLDLQLAHAEALDSKATTLLGFLAVGFGLFAGNIQKLHSWGRPLGIAIAVELGGSLFFALRALWVRGYDRSPSPEVVWRFASQNPDWIQHRLLSTRWSALAKNDVTLGSKVNNLKISMGIVGVVSATVIVASIIKLI